MYCRNRISYLIEPKVIRYTHKNIEFDWWGKLTISKPKSFIPIKLTLNNGSLSWRLDRETWLSVKQLKIITTELMTIKRDVSVNPSLYMTKKSNSFLFLHHKLSIQATT